MSDTTTGPAKPEFSVRIVVCDHYLSKPTPGIDVIYSEFRGNDIKQVPVLRIFGSTPEGRKACLHVHGVFPYFYVPCPTPNPEPQFLYQIAASLDKALNIALKQATSANQHVYKITLVKGLPFYGFHDKEHLYLKVFLYSPNLMKQAVELCANGAILGQTFQPHESHLNFTLQFFIDFNLFGMSNIDLQAVKFRRSGVSQSSTEVLETEFNLKTESICFYEADCVASHIINRQRIGRGDGIENPGLEEVWNQEKERRKQLNVSMASKSLSQGRIDTEQTDTHHKFQQMCLVKLSGLVDKPVGVESSDHIARKEDQIHYPAESLEGSQLFKAVDVSVHLPGSLYSSLSDSRRDLDATLMDDIDNTIVDESLALNFSLSLHYSQVQLNSEDLELVDLLQDMDEKPVEEDSVMATQPDVERDGDIDTVDAEYSQVFHDDKIFLEPFVSKDEIEDESSPSWNDSFWEGANIPQLDGTCDDDHVKKVRKRKMRPFKLGLARPKSKKKESGKELNTDLDIKPDFDDLDVINASRDTIDSISDLHLKKSVKIEALSILDVKKDSTDVCDSEESIYELVNKISVKQNNTELGIAEKYDLQMNFEPKAGPSNFNINFDVNKKLNESLDSYESTPEDKGIESFYDRSKFFDLSLNDSANCDVLNHSQELNVNMDIEDDHTNNFKVDNRDTKEIVDEIKNSDETNTQTAVIGNTKNSIESKLLDFRELPTNTTRLWLDTTSILTPKIRAPSKSYIASTLDKYNIPKVRNLEPFYSDHKDVGDKVEIGQMVLKLQSKLSRDQKAYEKVLNVTSIEEWRQLMFLQTNDINDETTRPDALKNLLASNRHCVLEPLARPPKTSEVKKWIDEERMNVQSETIDDTEKTKNLDELDNSQAIGLNDDEINSSVSLEVNEKEKIEVNTTLQVTMQPDGSFLCFGSGDSQKENSEVASVEVDYLTLMVIEVLTSVRGDLHPDPLSDPIQAIFLTIKNDCPENHFLQTHLTEIIVVDDGEIKLLDRCVFKENVTYVKTENELLETVIERVRQHDPDIMCGYEIEMCSWGYFLERCQVLGLEIVKDVSRITEKYRQRKWRSDDNDFEGRVIGRIMFNVWRLFRHELALSSYSFENCMYEILKERVPKYSYAQLYEWWRHESRILRWIPVEYYLMRLSGTVRMLEKLDIINRTSELARLFGLQWWEVLSRGSQFRVESLMLRAARPLNLVALSPTIRQRAAMKAPECLPLIFEPESRFYADPVIVLDFQSLYPSMMIAYNYCFSTCIGRVQNVNGDTSYEFGAWRLRVPKAKLEALVRNGLVNWSPVGVGFVKPSVRRGVLPALLRRILAARQAVKKGMKLQSDEGIKKAMHSRQLGLKLIANVTYGYTAANFSGRMPCVEVGDSVVAKGRETLQRAVDLVRAGPWNAKVVYGDTDSMFVLVPGGTRAEAFEIGQQIADAVTADNPSPVALKLEKVYQPSILQTKKRYVGFMYESADQLKPVYEAKGIETVRRDGCPAGVKLLQRSLCELFEHGDMSRVKKVVMATLCRLASGVTPPRELMFTREYHGAAGYRPGASAPPNEIAKRLVARDRRSGPRAGQRVAWQVCAGPPGAPLIKLARTPEELLKEPGLTPHVAYYATRVLLPPLHRCLSLLGANVFKWWAELGYKRACDERTVQGGIGRYMRRRRCAACGRLAARAICTLCDGQPAYTALVYRAGNSASDLQACHLICGSCASHSQHLKCGNTECPVIWRRVAAAQKLEQVNDVIAHLPTQFTDQIQF